MRLAQVVAVHPKYRTCDIVFCDTGMRVAQVHVLSSLVASDAGVWDMPSVPKPTSEATAGGPPSSGRQLTAVVDSVAGRPVVLGFLHPLGGQMAFDQDNRQVTRHASGAYSTIAPDGSIETWHPSGAYVRIGTGAHEPLAPLSWNQTWKETGDAAPPTVTLHAPKFDLSIDPDGNVTMHGQGNATMTADKTMTWVSGQDMHFNAGTTLSFTSQQGTTVSASGGAFSVTAPTINLN